MEQVLSLVEKARSFHSCKTLATDVEKGDIRKHRTAKHWMQCAEVVERRDTLRKCLKAKCSTHSLEVPQASTSSAGAGEPLYFDIDGQPIFTHMVNVPHANKHLIKFPIALDYMTLRAGKRWKIPRILLAALNVPPCYWRQTQGPMLTWWTDKCLINSLVRPRTSWNWLLSGWKTMEIQQ